MTRTAYRSVAASAALAAGLMATAAGISGQSGPTKAAPGTKTGEWPAYGADLAHTKYSPLDQINADNFSKLEIAWRFKTDNLGTRPEYKLEGTPLMVGGVLYATAGTRRSVVALDAATGEYVDMFKAGIIDPAKVTRSALQNAASIAGLFLTTEAVIAEKPEKNPPPAAPGGGDDMDF